MGLLKVKKNDSTVVNLRDPAKMSFCLYDLDSSETGRNQNGDLFRDRKSVKRKLTCNWSGLTNEQLQTILNATTDQFFELTFPNPMTGAMATMTCYVGDRTAPMYTYMNGKWIWESLSMNFIER